MFWAQEYKKIHTIHFKLYVQPCIFLSYLKYLHHLQNIIQIVFRLLGIVLEFANSLESWPQPVMRSLDNWSYSHCPDEVNEAWESRFGETLVLLKLKLVTLSGVTQWVEHGPVNKMVTSSIPSQGTCLGCKQGPQKGVCERKPHIDVSLPLFLLPSPLSKSK